MAPRRAARTQKQPARAPMLIGLLALAVLIAGGYLVAQGQIDLAGWLRRAGVDPAAVGLGARPTPAARVGAADGAIEVFFTTPSLIYPDVPRNRIPPPHERALIADIDAAQISVDAALYEYNLSSVAEALVRAQRRGVAVRVALDRENLDNPVMAKWAGMVEEAGIPVTWEESNAFQHSKFIVIDERLVWTGSWNATINDTYRNNNNLLRITVPAIVANYSAEFANFAQGDFGTSKRIETPNPVVRLGRAGVENYFTPRDRANAVIADWVDRARTSVEFMAFSFTTDEIADAMIRRHQAGLPVRGVFETRNATGTGSEYERLRGNGVEVLRDGNCHTMHHKVIIIDGRVVITGSYNFTGRAEEINDENMLVIDNPVIAQAYQQEFERVYAQARTPTRCE